MKLPRLLYGRYQEVERRCRKMVPALKKGAAWNDLAGEMVDTADVPGGIVLDGPAPNLGHEESFHCFAPARIVGRALEGGRLPESLYRAISAACFETHWGVLSLLGQDGRDFPDDGQYRDFLRAVLGFWDDFAMEGERYTVGTQRTLSLWQLPSTIGFVAARLGGITNERLFAVTRGAESPERFLSVLNAAVCR